jgi:hypothetical protein
MLSEPLQAFADFLRVDDDLIEVAATSRSGRSEEVRVRIDQICQQHMYKQSLLRHLDQALKPL